MHMAITSTIRLYGFGPTRSLRALWGLREVDAGLVHGDPAGHVLVGQHGERLDAD